MTRFEITMNVPSIGLVSHVIIAETLGEAQERAVRAHPSGRIIEAKKAWGKWL